MRLNFLLVARCSLLVTFCLMLCFFLLQLLWAIAQLLVTCVALIYLVDWVLCVVQIKRIRNQGELFVACYFLRVACYFLLVALFFPATVFMGNRPTISHTCCPYLPSRLSLFSSLVLLKEMRTREWSRISSCYFYVSCKSKELGGRGSPRFSCVTPVVESSSDLLRLIISS